METQFGDSLTGGDIDAQVDNNNNNVNVNKNESNILPNKKVGDTTRSYN